MNVIDGLPADEAGVIAGDVIIAFNGEDTPDYISLVDAIATTEPGKWVKMKVFRGGEVISINIKPVKRDDANASPDTVMDSDSNA